jgi:hypothetical protein
MECWDGPEVVLSSNDVLYRYGLTYPSLFIFYGSLWDNHFNIWLPVDAEDC